MKQLYIIRHVDYERLGWIPEILKELNIPYQSISLSEGDELPILSDVRGVISMGGPMSAYQTEEYPWIADEMAFDRKVVKNEIPMLGICLGGQILAQAFGAEVKRAELELGWTPLKKNACCSGDPVFSQLEVPSLFQFHYDSFALPEDCETLLSSEGCLNQAFCLSPGVYGVQFHPETNPQMIASVVEEYRDQVTEDQLISIQENAEEKAARGRKFLQDLLKALFVD